MARSRLTFLLLLALVPGCGDSTGAGNNVLSRGSSFVPANEGINLVTGALTVGPDADLYLSEGGGHLQLGAPRAGSAYVAFGTTAPSQADCNGGGLATSYWVDTLTSDLYSCMLLADGTRGYFHFPQLPSGTDSIRIAYLVWKP